MKRCRNTPSLQLFSMKRPEQKCNLEKKSILMNIDMNPMELVK